MFTIQDAYFRHDVSNRDELDSLGRYKVMVSSALRIAKKYKDFNNYISYFKTLSSLGATSYDKIVEKNLLKSNQYNVEKIDKLSIPSDIDLSNLHFSKSRKFIFS